VVGATAGLPQPETSSYEALGSDARVGTDGVSHRVEATPADRQSPGGVRSRLAGRGWICAVFRFGTNSGAAPPSIRGRERGSSSVHRFTVASTVSFLRAGSSRPLAVARSRTCRYVLTEPVRSAVATE
jgi:hypothetical protein